jgi:DNA ligase 1
MREFARLYGDLDATTSTSRKLDALKKYFNASESANAAWAVIF